MIQVPSCLGRGLRKKKFAKLLYFFPKAWYNLGCSPTKVAKVHSSLWCHLTLWKQLN